MATDADFGSAVSFVLAQEGGYVNDPADPGGETKYGISKRSYPYLDIASLTVDQAKAIYYTDYWEASGADRLPMPLALVVFDTAVNTGVGHAQDWLALSNGDVDQFLAFRTSYYQTLAVQHPTLAKYLNGWLNRIAALRNSLGLFGTVAVVGGVGLGTILVIGLGVWAVRRAIG